MLDKISNVMTVFGTIIYFVMALIAIIAYLTGFVNVLAVPFLLLGLVGVIGMNLANRYL